MSASAFQLPYDKREAERSLLLLTAEMHGEDGVTEVHLLNVSEFGAKLDSAMPPRYGERVTLVHADLRVSGVVAWVEDHRFGVAFDTPIDQRFLITRGQQRLSD